MAGRRKKPIDVKQACLDEAERILESDGAEAINLREVARRLGISHNAPYMHYASRDHVVAALVERSFDRFTEYLDRGRRGDTPEATVDGMLVAYLDFAQAHPAALQLMFNGRLPDVSKHPTMLSRSRRAYHLLHGAVSELPVVKRNEDTESAAHMAAMFVWSSIHGFAILLQSYAWKRLGFSEDTKTQLAPRLASQIRAGLPAGG